MSDKDQNSGNRKYSRRKFLKSTALGAGGVAAGLTLGGTAPYIRNAKAATLELRWLGWEHYNVKSLTAEFENAHGVKVSAGFFDGNSEAWNKLRAGGTQDFDLVMADGFWPQFASGRRRRSNNRCTQLLGRIRVYSECRQSR